MKIMITINSLEQICTNHAQEYNCHSFDGKQQYMLWPHPP